MAVYAIGDVQGCYDALQELLLAVAFDRTRDQLWFTGDLVNRGPQSAQVLRFVKDLGARAVTVLGNHDLHLLAIAHGQAPPKQQDNLQDVLNAPDRDALLTWLRQRPLLHHDTSLGYTLIHAGLLPQWGLTDAQQAAQEVEGFLRGQDYQQLFAHMYADEPDSWNPELTGFARLRVIINSFTRLRYCDAQGHMDLRSKGPPGTQAAHLLPWFKVATRRSRDLRVIFGHWSTLGVWNDDGVIGLDSGCLWGGRLTAVCLGDTPVFTSVACKRQQIPG